MTVSDRRPVVDHHCHLSPDGEGIAAAQRFHDLGGTHLFLATQNYRGATPERVDDYAEQFATTQTLARRIAETAGVGVFVVVAPYPVDLVAQVERLGRAAAVELHRRALDLAGREVREHRAVALGEVGRPHFPVAADVAGAADEAFDHALAVARDTPCPLVVHSEDLSADGYRDLAQRAAAASLPVGRVVKHFARAVASTEDLHGIVPSYLARRETVRAALDAASPWFLETDFLDDPGRPGAVLDLGTVPRRASAIRREGPQRADRLRVPFEDAVRAVYGIDLTDGGGAA